MGLWSFFIGKPPAELERVGDQYYAAGDFGLAKLQYERALDKASRKGPENPEVISSLHQKIANSKEELAKFHLHTATTLMESRNFAEAEDLLRLALELTKHPGLQQDIQSALSRLHSLAPSQKQEADAPAPMPTVDVMESEEEYFAVLCHALPEEVRQAYLGYGRTFRQGFIALNNGHFETAAQKLSSAFEEDPPNRALIQLELATALINLGQYDRASELVRAFVQEHPEELRGYQMICDIYWAAGRYEEALGVIGECPGALRESFPVRVLLGETYFLMGRYTEARTIFLACQAAFGPNEMISRALAKTFEALGDTARAKDIYSQILAGCARCGARTDPFVRRRYAELCFAAGERSSRVLELFFSVAQEDPDSRADCYRRISDIYQDMGNEAEARRYEALS